MLNPNDNSADNQKTMFLLVFAVITGVLLLTSYGVIRFVASSTSDSDPTPQEVDLSPLYVNYSYDEAEYISAQAYIAMGSYQQTYQNPQNVEILQGLTTQEINGHMMNYFVAGLGVGCSHCHTIEPDDDGNYQFHLYEWGDTPEINTREQNKYTALRHLEMVQDLNRNWIGNLDQLSDQKQPSGAQIVCATCHYGQAQPQAYPEDQAVLPDDFRLPLEEQYDLTAENIGVLNVNARSDISLDAVQYQQQVMYHMNESMNVGCTHCHNSRYFPSREVPAIHYSQNMLQMSQYIWLNYSDSMNGQKPSCTLCHNGAILPPGAARSAESLPAALVEQSDDDSN